MLEISSGVCVVHDELAGWTASFDNYRKGGDRQQWLSLWAGSPLKVDRKTAPTVFVPNPVVCVTGGVQPDRLPDLRGSTVNDGFSDRFLLAWPETVPARWTNDADCPATVDKMTAIFRRLSRLQETEPVILCPSPEAQQLFVHYYNDNADAVATASGIAAGWGAKAPSHLARLALVLHALSGPDRINAPISADTMDAAIRIAEYFRAHLNRCLPSMGATGTSRSAGDIPRVRRWLAAARDGQPDGWVSRSDLMQQTRLSAEQMSTALTELEDRGEAEHQTSSTATRDREDWRLRLPAAP